MLHPKMNIAIRKVLHHQDEYSYDDFFECVSSQDKYSHEKGASFMHEHSYEKKSKEPSF